MPINQVLKRSISEVKFKFNLTQSEIAEKLGVKSTYLSDMINGRVPFTENISYKISELFHIGTEDVSQKKETNFVAENEAAYEAKKMDPCHIIIDTLTRSNAMLIETNAKQQEEIHRLVNMIEGKKKNGLNGGAQNAGDVAV